MALFDRLRSYLAFHLGMFLADVQRAMEVRTRGPIAGGAPEGDTDADADADKDKDAGDADADKDADKDDADAGDDEDKVTKDDDWETKSRKNERRAKRERKLREDAEAKARKLEERDKTDQQKAIDKAREEGEKTALSKADKDRRTDRLEVAVTRLASKGITVGEGDEAVSKRFADTDDALLNIERAISKGEIDEADIFDDEGKVDADALKTELADLLKRKPHLAEGAGAERRDPGDPDTGKGGAAKSDLEDMTPEEHAERKYGKK